MNRFVVRAYVATHWSFFTQADHFEEHHFTSKESLYEFATRIAKVGFGVGKKWIMPGAIISVEQE